MTLLLLSLRYLFDGRMRPIARVVLGCQLYYSVAYHILRPAIIWCPMMIVHWWPPHYHLLQFISVVVSLLVCLSFKGSSTRLCYVTTMSCCAVRAECFLFYICPCVMRWLPSLTRPSGCDILYYTLPHPASHTSLRLVAYPYIGYCLYVRHHLLSI